MLVAMTLLSAFFAYHINWMHQRRRELVAYESYHKHQSRTGDAEYKERLQTFCHPFMARLADNELPLMLRALGEAPQSYLEKEWDDEATWLRETDRLEEIFPEAVIWVEMRGGDR
ncbi:hypothetical protein [Lacipirellula limnantheis]|uniref:Uncharacterized protein n=1 Tax=Lacipirellula limnantheis TaxID=2528024 RepID=A0A517U1I7_9BACT|nr:hypothetical protein [Lacipirellula limnantheis]QDT74494.1 hypothetical protein I41_36910 [Lacipirellula limnantheis]